MSFTSDSNPSSTVSVECRRAGRASRDVGWQWVAVSNTLWTTSCTCMSLVSLAGFMPNLKFLWVCDCLASLKRSVVELQVDISTCNKHTVMMLLCAFLPKFQKLS